MWSLFAQDYDPVEWCVIVFSGALAISSGLWWLSPRISWYVGASGVLHTIMAAGVARHLAVRAWDRWILLVCLCGKLAYEQLGGREPAHGRRRRPPVRRRLRICGRCCTLVAYRYNSPPFPRIGSQGSI